MVWQRWVAGAMLTLGAGIGVGWQPAAGNAATRTGEIVPRMAPMQLADRPASAKTWRKMTDGERSQALDYILSSPLGIAAFNQLAIEGYINAVCPKVFYTNEQTSGFQTLMQIKCPNARGTSTAREYKEVRVLFNRFESNIESFQIERVYADTAVDPLPE